MPPGRQRLVQMVGLEPRLLLPLAATGAGEPLTALSAMLPAAAPAAASAIASSSAHAAAPSSAAAAATPSSSSAVACSSSHTALALAASVPLGALSLPSASSLTDDELLLEVSLIADDYPLIADGCYLEVSLIAT